MGDDDQRASVVIRGDFLPPPNPLVHEPHRHIERHDHVEVKEDGYAEDKRVVNHSLLSQSRTSTTSTWTRLGGQRMKNSPNNNNSSQSASEMKNSQQTLNFLQSLHDNHKLCTPRIRKN